MTEYQKRRVSADNYFAIIPEWVLYSEISPTGKIVYAVLQRYANSENVCFPSRKTISERIHVSIKTVDRALDELEQLGALKTVRRMNSDGSFTSNLYHLTSTNPGNPVTVVGTNLTLPGDKFDARGRDKNDTLIRVNTNQSQESDISCSSSFDDGDKLLKREGGKLLKRDDLFADFWAAYPRKKGKQQALKAWIKAVKDGADPTLIVLGAERYATERTSEDPQYTAHPATWLNAGRWEDEPDPTHTPKTTTRQHQTDIVQAALQRIKEQKREITQ
jgi:DNA-binding MarR family transcriptional regulator